MAVDQNLAMGPLQRNSEILDELIQSREDDEVALCSELINVGSASTMNSSQYQEFVNPLAEQHDSKEVTLNQLRTNAGGQPHAFGSGQEVGDALSPYVEVETDDLEPRPSSSVSGDELQTSPSFVFVAKRATRFGLGTSSSDAFFDRSDLDNEESEHFVFDDGMSDDPHEEQSQITFTAPLITDDRELKGFHDNAVLSDSTADEGHNKMQFLSEPDDNDVTLKEDSSESLELNGAIETKRAKSPLLTSLMRPGKNHSNKIHTSKFPGKDSEKHPILDPSLSKSEESSDEDSALINDSEDTEHIFSPSNLSEDTENQAVCSKYSQLSEDGSFPSSPVKSPTSDSETDTGKDAGDTAKIVFDHPLDLGVAFSEYVDIDSFQASLGKRTPRTEEGYGGKSEEHLLVLLKSNSLKNLKRYLRKSYSSPESNARRKLWENLCVHLLKAGGSLYNSVSAELYQGLPEEDYPLPSFVDQQHLLHYHLTAAGRKTLKTILDVISSLSPDIVFCPLLYPMASLFLHYCDAESCCNCMQALLRSTAPTYLTQTRTAADATKFVLRDLAKKYTKKAYDLVSRSSNNVESVYENWEAWIFRDLPFQYLVCVVDSYLLEGYKVLYRIALAIVQLYTKDVARKGGQQSPVTNVSAAISRFCRNLPDDSRKLLKEAFGIKRLTRREIGKLQNNYERFLKVQSESEEGLPRVTSRLSMGQADTSKCTFSGPVVLDRADNSILTNEMLHKIWGWVPRRLTLKRLTQLYTSEEHGFSLTTMYARTEMYEPVLMVIKAATDEIFGAYCTMLWG
ncbi:uncharacterized protein LOC101858574 isoform X2 [Aplysia californica]|uniref:Uncharacterized protein LOC101858574 isoform X2 n=1 Tax=Aplysia californica TaxID=6500 RepID=A0ABM1A983_APLCA|nr:uncharacterized protein LOC101858574 isoform X2 [Aplysia californica]